MKMTIISGCSATGKDTILNKVLKRSNYVPVVSTTSRPMREGEVEGREYYFIDDETSKRMLENGDFIETRIYHTVHGDWIYGISKDAIDLNSDNHYITIVDVQGKDAIMKYLYENGVKYKDMTTFFIDCDVKTTILRSLNREPHMTDKQALEVCRRTIADYNEIKVHKDEYQYVLTNEKEGDLEDCVNAILDRSE